MEMQIVRLMERQKTRDGWIYLGVDRKIDRQIEKHLYMCNSVQINRYNYIDKYICGYIDKSIITQINNKIRFLSFRKLP